MSATASPQTSPKDIRDLAYLLRKTSLVPPNIQAAIDTALAAQAQGAASQRALDDIGDYLRAAVAFMQSETYMKTGLKSGDRNLHCVRCHGEFKERENKSNSCRIPCMYDPEPVSIAYGCDYEALCCPGAMVHEETPGNGDFDYESDWYCFEGKHTTDPAAVKYNGYSIYPCRPKSQTRPACRLYPVIDDYTKGDGPFFDFQNDPDDDEEEEDDDDDDEEMDSDSM